MECTEAGLQAVAAVNGVSVGLIELIDELAVCLPGVIADFGIGKALRRVRGDFGGGLGGRSSFLHSTIVVLIGGSGGIRLGMAGITIGAIFDGKSIEEARF